MIAKKHKYDYKNINIKIKYFKKIKIKIYLKDGWESSKLLNQLLNYVTILNRVKILI